MKRLLQVREGQIVRVNDGPFTGFLGEVTAVNDQIVKVAVQVYGRDTPADLALGQVEVMSKTSN